MARALALLSRRGAAAALLKEFYLPGGRSQYLTYGRHAEWLKSAHAFVAALDPASLADDGIPDGILGDYKTLAALVRAAEGARQHRNTLYVQAQRSKHESLLTKGQGYSLNEAQVQAVLHDEQRCLVVAGAGTGKTSTIVGKALHVLAEPLAEPREVLLLAFTRKAAQEMEERLERLSGRTLSVKTFHALGLQILAESGGRKPSLSRLAEDENALATALQGWILDLVKTQGLAGPIAQFFVSHRYPWRDPDSFKTAHEHHQYVRGHDVRTLRGERVKSVEESDIANWLTAQGIQYEYERGYEHDTASIRHRQYRPDFFLPAYKIYIEHFGINKRGQPPPFNVRPQEYIESMHWKRELHRSHGTRLVETYSHMKKDGILLQELERRLVALGVVLRPISASQLHELASTPENVTPVTRLVSSFLSLFKGNAWTMDEVRPRMTDERGRVFLSGFEQIMRRYDAALREENAIDFSDMIAAATQAVAEGRFSSSFRYLLVDEFQDISRGRARLLQALLGQVNDARLFCVGDDWQSIYRFAGSDIDLMTRFQEHFGFMRRTDLAQTHRFGTALLNASSRFIATNPQQLQKTLIAARESSLPAIEIASAPSRSEKRMLCERTIETIARDDRRDKIEVLVLGRYHFCLEDLRGIRPADSRLSLRFMTVHAAKGLEADYAIVVDVVGGRYGFPTEITDDPLLDVVLAGRGSFPNAEERRLFYVALSRARTKCYVLTDDIDRSVFVDELEQPCYAGLVIPSGAAARTVSCPACQGGRLERREGQWGLFWGCSNYPVCKAKARACPWCGAAAFVPSADEYRCASKTCGKTAPLCPACKVGALVPREGKFGPFLGCTEWRRDPPSCGHTRSLGPRGARLTRPR